MVEKNFLHTYYRTGALTNSLKSNKGNNLASIMRKLNFSISVLFNFKQFLKFFKTTIIFFNTAILMAYNIVQSEFIKLLLFKQIKLEYLLYL